MKATTLLLFKKVILMGVMLSGTDGYCQSVPLYNPDFNRMQYALDRMQVSYNTGSNKVIGWYDDLQTITLFNKQNVAFILELRAMAKVWWEKTGSRLDYSDAGNVSSASKFLNQYYEIPTIAEEIRVLNKVYNELDAIKAKRPDDFQKSERFQQLVNVLNLMTSCEPGNISLIAKDNYIF